MIQPQSRVSTGNRERIAEAAMRTTNEIVITPCERFA
jgi:hypothetical protein